MERIFEGLKLASDMPLEIRQVFSRLRPLCSELMVNPHAESLERLLAAAAKAPRPVLQEMQLYLLFPIVHHLKSSELRKKYEVQRTLVDGMAALLKLINVTSIEAFLKCHNCLIFLIFDKQQPGMVGQVPEELKLSVLRTVTVLVLRLTEEVRLHLYRSAHTPLVAQCIYIAVQIAKRDKLRALRLEAMDCVQALMGTHPELASDYRPRSHPLTSAAAELVSGILPGVVGGLQDVAVSTENQGHAVTAKALTCIHCAVCLVMCDARQPRAPDATDARFAELLISVRSARRHPEPSDKAKPTLRSPQYFQMAGNKLKLVTKSLMCLQSHDHSEVRLSLATFCSRILLECAGSMAPSVRYVLEVLMAMSEDDCPRVSALCSDSLSTYFRDATSTARAATLESLADNLYVVIASLPRVMNNIDTAKKMSALNLLRGYFSLLAGEKLTQVLSSPHTLAMLCSSLVHAVTMDASRVSLLLQDSIPDMSATVLSTSPWLRLTYLEEAACEELLRRVCALLATTDCAEPLLDRLLEMFREGQDRAELVYLINCFIEAAPIHVDMVINTYIEPDTWYLPLEVGSEEPPLSSADTLDPVVYNPRSWERDSVPGLYEGTVETRYTDLSYQESRMVTAYDTGGCRTLRAARDNMVLACLLTEGVGVVARQLRDKFQPYLLRTLCLLLERVGSKYEMLRWAGLKALNDVTLAGGHEDISALVRANADYFTYQVTVRLKKSWNSESALQILTVVMQHSDASILPCLHGIINNVLLPSCDRYHVEDASAYLQVFLTYVECIQRWFPETFLDNDPTESDSNWTEWNVLSDTVEYIKNVEVPERLMAQKDFEEETGQTVEEMFQEDLKKKQEDDAMDYSDVNEENEEAAAPEHVATMLVMLRRCVHFMSSRSRPERLLALRVARRGLPLLARRESDLLPLCHVAWSPLVAGFADPDPLVFRDAFLLLVEMARLAKDFIRNRAIKEALPCVWQRLRRSAAESALRDAGSAYRASAAYRLQLALLSAAAPLALDLRLGDAQLEEALAVISPYLSNRQPRPLQAAAVAAFRLLLSREPGAAWHHLRALGRSAAPVAPPPRAARHLPLHSGVAAHPPADTAYRHSFQAVFAE